jgi:hypothetical protein
MLNEVFNFYLRNHTSQENVYEPGDYIPFADTSFTLIFSTKAAIADFNLNVPSNFL